MSKCKGQRRHAIRKWLATVSGIFGLVLGTANCNQIGGIKDGVPRGDDPVVPCATVEDCAKVEAAECRVPIGCEQKLCTYGDAVDGALAKTQVSGDCTDIVCDGAGKSKLVAQGTDVPDDNNVCTLDACNGMMPTFTIQTEVVCYTGPAATRATGVCVEGIQHCDAQGNAMGGCEGEVVPSAETCVSPLDEDCDGKANEEGQGCVCVPGDVSVCYTGLGGTDGVGICHGGMQMCNSYGLGYGACIGEQTPKAETCDAAMVDEDCDGEVNESGADCMCGDGYLSAGEECDDGNVDSTDACTELCKVAVCGDGFLQAVVETCDDGNADNTDACLTTCFPASCGDGFVQPGRGETCDDGGTTDGDPCSPTCKEQKVLQVAGGPAHTCARLSDGSVKCWGQNQYGELGLGDTTSRGDGPDEMGNTLPTVNLGVGKTASAIVVGGAHTCALLNDGSVKCWGQNLLGQLGQGDMTRRGDEPGEMGDNLPTVNLGTGKTASVLVAGANYTCALLNDGGVKCWGYNAAGQLGLGDTNYRGDGPNEMGNNLPNVNLGTGKTASAIIAGFEHMCALLNDGTVKCWGSNSFGQLGLGDTTARGDAPNEMGDSLPAVNFGTAKTASAIIAGYAHTCALLNDGSVKCWGANTYGALGLGDTAFRGDGPNEMGDNLSTVTLGTGKTASAMTAGAYWTCAVLNDGKVKCWGRNEFGQLGLGDINNRGDVPNEMGDNLPTVNLGTGKMIFAEAAGGFHMCALLDDRSVKCWGNNSYGQLGLGDTTARGDGPNEMGDNLPTVKLFSPFW